MEGLLGLSVPATILVKPGIHLTKQHLSDVPAVQHYADDTPEQGISTLHM